MSRTNRNRRKKRNSRRILALKGFDYWHPLVIDPNQTTWCDTLAAKDVLMGAFTSKPYCEERDLSYEGRYEGDKLGKECDHHDNDRNPETNPHYLCEGTYEMLTDGSCNKHYGPRKCPACNDQHHNCMRVKCNKCGHITHRFYRYDVMHFKLDIPNPRRTVLWMPLESK